MRSILSCGEEGIIWLSQPCTHDRIRISQPEALGRRYHIEFNPIQSNPLEPSPTQESGHLLPASNTLGKQPPCGSKRKFLCGVRVLAR